MTDNKGGEYWVDMRAHTSWYAPMIDYVVNGQVIGYLGIRRGSNVWKWSRAHVEKYSKFRLTKLFIKLYQIPFTEF